VMMLAEVIHRLSPSDRARLDALLRASVDRRNEGKDSRTGS
jgi:hypothetical protein